MSLDPGHTTQSSHSSFFFRDTFILIALRLGSGLICRRLLLSALNPTLRELSTTDSLSSTQIELLPTHSSVDVVHSEADTEDDASYSPPVSSIPLSTTLSPRHDPSSGPAPADLGHRLQHVQVLKLNHGKAPKGSSPSKRNAKGLGRLAKALFCACFAEVCNLIALVAFHAIGLLHVKSRQFNFSLSLHLILTCILVVIPWVQCLLLTYRSTMSTTTTTPGISLRSRMLVACIPFALYCFLFTCIPPYVNSNSSSTTLTKTSIWKSDWEEQSWLGSILGRVVVLGIVTLGGLSGFGAMRTAWNFFEHVTHGRSEPLTDSDISRAEQSLYRVRRDLLSKREEANRPRPGASEQGTRGWMGRLFSGNEENGDRAEVEGLEAMESQMTRSLKATRERKARQEFSRTLLGKVYYLLGFCFATYCAARLLMCLPSIFFPPLSTNVQTTTAKGRSNGDWISYLLALTISHLPVGTVDINVALWSRTISLLLTGLLILSSLAQILRSVSKMVRLTSRAAGASFLLLGLGQLFSVYVISLLVQMRTSLPPSPDNDDFERQPSLLETLPDFSTFGRLFDSVFLLAALGTSVYRYIANKVDSYD